MTEREWRIYKLHSQDPPCRCRLCQIVEAAQGGEDRWTPTPDETPDLCPKCGSDTRHVLFDLGGPLGSDCSDPWHDTLALADLRPERCPTCGSENRGLRHAIGLDPTWIACDDPWHDAPATATAASIDNMEVARGVRDAMADARDQGERCPHGPMSPECVMFHRIMGGSVGHATPAPPTGDREPDPEWVVVTIGEGEDAERGLAIRNRERPEAVIRGVLDPMDPAHYEALLALDALVAERDEARETADDALDTMLEYERERDALVAERDALAHELNNRRAALATERERADRLAVLVERCLEYLTEDELHTPESRADIAEIRAALRATQGGQDADTDNNGA